MIIMLLLPFLFGCNLVKNSVILDVSYTEPVTVVDGSRITDLEGTRVRYFVDNELVEVKDIKAKSSTGGNRVSVLRSFNVSDVVGKVVKVEVSAINRFGESDKIGKMVSVK